MQFLLRARKPCHRRKHGFTLVELLVVVAIIGVLIGLVLPAIQEAREASRRSTCLNNQKQLALGLHLFHEARRSFPSGVTASKYDSSSTNNWGHSFFGDILPFIEFSEIYARLKIHTEMGYGIGGSNYSAAGANIPKVSLPVLLCPSSPLPRACVSTYSGLGGTQRSDYVGISGASMNLWPASSAIRVSEGTRTFNDSGLLTSSSGLLIPHGADPSKGPVMRMSAVLDGLSKTLLVSEYSDFLTDTSGNNVNWSLGAQYGWFRGAFAGNSGTPVVNWTPPDGSPLHGGYSSTTNLTTIAFAINDKYKKTDYYYGGIAATGSNQHPLNSAHRRGVVAAMADGAVLFLSDDTDLKNVLVKLAVRDDGQTLDFSP